MDPGQRMASGTFSEHGQNDWMLDTTGDEAYLDDFVLHQVPRASRSRFDVVDDPKVEVRNPKEGMNLSIASSQKGTRSLAFSTSGRQFSSYMAWRFRLSARQHA
jgi:hypothetical protein